jgi:hypothetical protein
MERYELRRSSAQVMSWRRFGLGAMVVVTLAGLQACQTTSSPSGPAGTVPGEPLTTARPPLPSDSPLASEARWLTELFAGTPVQVVSEQDGSVRLNVPMKYAFDPVPASGAVPPSATAPKPPLQAVLDKVSQSLKRQPTAKLQAAAPAGPRAAERLAALRSHLATRGVANWRIAAASAPAEDQVLLRLVAPPGGVRMLDDGTLAPTGAGRVLPPAKGGSGAVSPR